MGYSVVEKAWKGIGRNHEEILPIEKFGGTRRKKRKDRNRPMLALRNKVRGGIHRYTGGLKERN